VALVIPDVLEESCATRQALRHAELRRRLPGITQKVLTETLRGMEKDALIERRVLKDTAPQHVEYTLTELGQTLRAPLSAICAWALEHG
jgi:DNA-binding HxlR family transcriptional regulator